MLIDGAELVATLDAEDREIAGGWLALDAGLITAVGGPADERPAAARVLRADGCLVTPGLVNTHHHIYQNLTRAHRPSVNASLFTWLTTLYPLWAGLDEEAAYLSAWVGSGRARARRLHDDDRPPLRPSAPRRGPDLRRDRGGHGARGPLPPDPRLDEPVGQGRRPAAGLGGAGRRRDPRRQRAAGGPSSRPVLGGDGADRPRALLAVLRLARPDATHGGAGRATRRAPAHPPGRGPRRGPLRRPDLRPAHHRPLRGRRLADRTAAGSRTASTPTTTRYAGSARPASGSPTARRRTC